MPEGGVDVGEEGVGIGGGVEVDVGDFERSGQGHGLAVDFAASYNEGLWRGGHGFNGSLKRGENLDTGSGEFRAATHHDVAPSRQGAFGEGLECASAHNYRAAHGEGLEATQVGAQVANHVAATTDGSTAGDGNYDAKVCHTDTCAAM